MTSAAHLRQSATSLPEVAEGTHRGASGFAVSGSAFVSVVDGTVRLDLAPDDLEAALATHPTASATDGVLTVPLADLDGQQLNHLVTRAWVHRAPDRLVDAWERAAAARPGHVGDLPRGIGRPATQALVLHGITTLDQVAARTDADLLALHGVGRRAVDLLREALSARG